MGQGIKLAVEAGMLQDGYALGDVDSPAVVQRMSDLRTEINATYRAIARSGALHQAVIQAAKELPPVNTPGWSTPEHNTPRSLVLAMGDFHYGAEWEIKGLRGEVVNRYNPEVFEARMWALLGEVAAILEKEDTGHIHILLCGDALDGMLRQSQLMKLRYGVVESVMRLSEFLTRWIEALSVRAQVSLYNVDGNHSEVRPLGSKRGDFENENLEKVLVWYLAARFEGQPRVQIDPVSEKRKLVAVQGYKFLLTHGDDAKSLEALAKQTVLLYGEPIDFFVCGHKHREQEAVTGYTGDGNSMVLRVPSFCGADGYAQK